MTARDRAPLPWMPVAALAVLLVACGGDAPTASTGAAAPSAAAPDDAAVEADAQLPQGSLEAVALELGVAIDADGRVLTPVERVRSGDPVHVSLVTVGEADAAMLGITWRDAAGTEIDSDERAITAEGPAVHTFTRTPDGGWSPGRYEVEVRINGDSAGVRSFDVR